MTGRVMIEYKNLILLFNIWDNCESFDDTGKVRGCSSSDVPPLLLGEMVVQWLVQLPPSKKARVQLQSLKTE